LFFPFVGGEQEISIGGPQYQGFDVVVADTLDLFEPGTDQQDVEVGLCQRSQDLGRRHLLGVVSDDTIYYEVGRIPHRDIKGFLLSNWGHR